jgi:hypothetical protein
LTAYSGEDVRQHALESGFDHDLTRPLDLTVLQPLLARE